MRADKEGGDSENGWVLIKKRRGEKSGMNHSLNIQIQTQMVMKGCGHVGFKSKENNKTKMKEKKNYYSYTSILK